MLELQDRLYTSTEVADILGVSLRSVYRYLEESKLHAEVKTATGRHRFTKNNILNFLYPEGVPQAKTTATQKIVPDTKRNENVNVSDVDSDRVEVKVVSDELHQEEVSTNTAAGTVVEESSTELEEDEPIDWLAKFREAATKFKEEETQKGATAVQLEPAVQPEPAPQPVQEVPQPQPAPQPVPVVEETPVKYSEEPAFATSTRSGERVSDLSQPEEPEEAPVPQPVQPVPQPAPQPTPQPATPPAPQPVQAVPQPAAPQPVPQPVPQAPQPQPEPEFKVYYYKSDLGGLKEIAQNIDKSARSSKNDYTFTMNAGLSLFKPIKPFSLLHVYIRPEDREQYERQLKLNPATEDDAQLCLILSKDNKIFSSKIEMHGLYVVSKMQLIKDIDRFGDPELVSEAQSIIG
jgi:hypothetical protein